ncbi:MAG: glycosyltransferase [Gemmataceae bacterium]
MKVSVAICTWNRAALLDQTLASFQELTIPPGLRWEILIVNNNCTDETQKVIEKYRTVLPIVALLETKQGQSHARNCATNAATGDVIVWTDDDVKPDPQWLVQYVEAFSRYPDASFFGGKIKPWYESVPPLWISENEQSFQGMLVIRDLGAEERQFAVSTENAVQSESPFGANMAVRTDVQRRHMYDPKLGKVKNSNVTADETDMFRRIRESGGHGMWIPSASIKHFVTRSRMTTRYLWSYHHGQGQSEVRTQVFLLPWNTPVFNHAPRWVYKKKYVTLALSWSKWLVGHSDWAVTYARYAKYAGMIDEFHAMNWQPPPPPPPQLPSPQPPSPSTSTLLPHTADEFPSRRKSRTNIPVQS